MSITRPTAILTGELPRPVDKEATRNRPELIALQVIRKFADPRSGIDSHGQ